MAAQDSRHLRRVAHRDYPEHGAANSPVCGDRRRPQRITTAIADFEADHDPQSCPVVGGLPMALFSAAVQMRGGDSHAWPIDRRHGRCADRRVR